MSALGRGLIGAAAVSTLIVPIGVDGFLFADAHMNNPAWLPHAKLHCAMSFFGAIGLGLAALMILRVRPADDRASMGIAAFCATAFWAGLIASGWWPGTSYDFLGDPANYVAPPRVWGVATNLNVVVAVVTIIMGWTGYALVARSPAQPRVPG